MKNSSKGLKKVCFFVLGTLLAHSLASADPIWHCSRSRVQIANASDDFSLAALSYEREVIRISLRDLYAVYQGLPVKLAGGIPLSACVLDNRSDMATTALKSIGALPPSHPYNSAPTSSLHKVQNESEMHRCIQANHPAVGYLSKATPSKEVGPCF
jgi:hypothetical protein